MRGGAARGAREARVHATRRRQRCADGEHVVQEGGVAGGLALVRSVAAVVARARGREPQLGDVEVARAAEVLVGRRGGRRGGGRRGGGRRGGGGGRGRRPRGARAARGGADRGMD